MSTHSSHSGVTETLVTRPPGGRRGNFEFSHNAYIPHRWFSDGIATLSPMRLRNLLQPIVFVPVLIVVAIVGVWWFAFRPDNTNTASAATTKQLATVTSGPMSVTVSAEGTVAAAQTDNLSFSSPGTVSAVDVAAGDTVKAGQVLATLDSASLQASVTSAQADVASAQAKLSDDEASGASSDQITADESSLTSANDSLTNANQALANASLVATFDGTVAAVNITNGEQLSSSGTGATAATGTGSGSGQSSANLGSSNSRVAAAASSSSSSSSSSSAQIQVVSTGRYTVQLAVDTADIASVAVGQTATITRTTSSAANGRFGGGGGGGFAALFGRLAGAGGAGAGTGAATGAGGTGTGGAGGGTGTGGVPGRARRRQPPEPRPPAW